jgi:sulfur-oxidizing protein SoxX
MTTGTDHPRRIAEFLLVTALNATVAAAAFDVSAQSVPRPGNAAPKGIAEFHVVRDGIPDSISGSAGDASRGRTLIIARDAANCVLCHAISDPGVRFAGNLGPSLDGVGGRMSVAQLRLRVADSLRIEPDTIMPSYYRVEGLDRVSGAYRGMPILDAGQVEDIVAYLATLQ